MSLNANKVAGGGNRAPVEPMDVGTYPARAVMLIDLGVQEQRAFGDKKKPPMQDVMLTWEFVDEFLKNEEGEDILDKPRWLSERFPFHNIRAEKARSTLRINAMDPEGEHGGDMTKCLSTPCMVTVTHNPNHKTGGVYENIADVKPMRPKDAEKCAPLVNPTRVFDMDTPDLEVFNYLPEWIQGIVKGGLEYEGSKLWGMLGGNADKGDESPEEMLDDENPY